MRAVRLNRFGGPEVLELIEVPTPPPGPGQVLVRVHASGVNFSETLMRQDRYVITPPLPSILGSEVTGVIEALGEGVDRLQLGARVAAAIFATPSAFGGYAEYVVVDADYVAPLPDALGFADATALMAQGLTALHLTQQAPPKGKRVLITAAAGGVGTLLVQLAKAGGASLVIAGASSDEKLATARALGADLGVNYARKGWSADLVSMTDGAGPDIVYESVGGEVTGESLRTLAPLGQIVIYGALNIQGFNLGVAELIGLIFKNQSVTGFATVPLLTPATLRCGLTHLFDLAVRGELKVMIGGAYPMTRAAEAHQALEGRGARGKLVLIP